MDDALIQKLMKNYTRHLEYNRNKYHNTRKHDIDFMEKNRERARKHYLNNRESKQKYYNNNRDLINAKSSYNYYLKKNDVEKFKNKYPNRYDLLLQTEYITE